LLERTILTSEVRGSNPIIGNTYYEYVNLLYSLQKRRIQRKRDREWLLNIFGVQ